MDWCFRKVRVIVALRLKWNSFFPNRRRDSCLLLPLLILLSSVFHHVSCQLHPLYLQRWFCAAGLICVSFAPCVRTSTPSGNQIFHMTLQAEEHFLFSVWSDVNVLFLLISGLFNHTHKSECPVLSQSTRNLNWSLGRMNVKVLFKCPPF